jgi:hypothetical protein
MEKKDYSGGPWARPVRTVFFSMLWLVVLCGIWVAFTAPPPKPRTVEDEQRNAMAEKARLAAEKDRQQFEQAKRELCHFAAVCKKYDTVRLECATAGNFKTCLRIKMGGDADFTNSCNGFNEGGPAVPPPVGTPSTVECFFLTNFQ